MILVDTSVWIDHFTGAKNRYYICLKSAIKNSEDLCICGVILTEVLQGIRRDREFEKVLRILDELLYLAQQKSTHILAAEMYRFLRKKGKTIRKPIDCIIAAISMENSAHILHNDKDFEVISKYFPLQRFE